MSNQLLLLPIRQMTGKSKEEAQFSVWLLPAAIILPRPDFTLIFNSSRSFPPAPATLRLAVKYLIVKYRPTLERQFRGHGTVGPEKI